MGDSFSRCIKKFWLKTMPQAVDESLEPNETLYVNNLNDRIAPKKLQDELMRGFSKFGSCEVIVMSSLRRRGQAWIIYETQESSKAALHSLQGETVFGKPMRIDFSRNISDATLIRKGLPRVRSKKESIPQELTKRTKTAADVPTFFSVENASSRGSATISAGPRSYTAPNRVLIVENYSESTQASELECLFSSYPGFVELRVIPGRGVAFVEFTDDHRSQPALNNLNGKELKDGSRIFVSNSKV
jgi:RNA recognition motif-containing protein